MTWMSEMQWMNKWLNEWHDMTWNEMKLNEVKWMHWMDEWNEMDCNEMKGGEMNEMKGGEMNEMKGSEMNEMKGSEIRKWWMNEWMNDWMNEWMNAWMDESMSCFFRPQLPKQLRAHQLFYGFYVKPSSPYSLMHLVLTSSICHKCSETLMCLRLYVRWSSRISPVHLLPASSSKISPKVTAFCMFNPKSSATVLCVFCRQLLQIAETDTLLWRPHKPFSPRKNRVLRPRVLTSMNWGIPGHLLMMMMMMMTMTMTMTMTMMAWWWWWWQDDMVDMMVRPTAHDNGP